MPAEKRNQAGQKEEKANPGEVGGEPQRSVNFACRAPQFPLGDMSLFFSLFILHVRRKRKIY